MPFDTSGLDFALTALFVVLLVEQFRTVRHPLPYLIAVLAGILAWAGAAPRDFLLVAISLSLGGLLFFRRRLEGKSGQQGSATHPGGTS